MQTFDRSRLRVRLENLAPQCQTIFALSCAKRFMPLYKAFCDESGRGHWELLRSTLDRLWSESCCGTTGQEDKLFLENYEDLVPGDSVPRSDRTMLDPLAENAILALESACEHLLSHDSEKAIWAAGQAYEAADYVAHNLADVNFGEPNAETLILENKLVQNELERQLDDLAELEKNCRGPNGMRNVAATLRGESENGWEGLQTIIARLIAKHRKKA